MDREIFSYSISPTRPDAFVQVWDELNPEFADLCSGDELWRALFLKKEEEKENFWVGFYFGEDINDDPDAHTQEFEMVLETFRLFRRDIARVNFSSRNAEEEKRMLLSMTSNLVILTSRTINETDIFSALQDGSKLERISSFEFHNAEPFRTFIGSLARFQNLKVLEVGLQPTDQNASEFCGILCNLLSGALTSIGSVVLHIFGHGLTEQGLPAFARFLASRHPAIALQLHLDEMYCFQSKELTSSFMQCLTNAPPTVLLWHSMDQHLQGGRALEVVASILKCMEGPGSYFYAPIDLQGEELISVFLQALSETELQRLILTSFQGSADEQRDMMLSAFAQNTTTIVFSVDSFTPKQKEQCRQICQRNKTFGKVRTSIQAVNEQSRNIPAATTGLGMWPLALQRVQKLGHHSATPTYIIVEHLIGMLSETGRLALGRINGEGKSVGIQKRKRI